MCDDLKNKTLELYDTLIETNKLTDRCEVISHISHHSRAMAEGMRIGDSCSQTPGCNGFLGRPEWKGALLCAKCGKEHPDFIKSYVAEMEAQGKGVDWFLNGGGSAQLDSDD
eukprot:g25610.t1